jgi:serine/threonine protein kinase
VGVYRAGRRGDPGGLPGEALKKVHRRDVKTKILPIPQMDKLTNFFKQFKPNDTDKAGSSACAPVLLGSGAGGDGYKVHDLVVKCFWCCSNPKPTMIQNGILTTSCTCETCKKRYRDKTKGIQMLNEELALNKQVITMLNSDILKKYTPIIEQTTINTNCRRTIKVFKQMPHIVSKGGVNVCDLFELISVRQGSPIQTNNVGPILLKIQNDENLFALKLINCMFQVCNGLKTGNMYHHDIKPENIFVSVTGTELNVVLGDYGLMGIDQSNFVGTPGYTGFDPNTCPPFVEQALWCDPNSYSITGKLRNSNYGPYFEKSWDRTLYSIAKTCFDAFSLSTNFMLEMTLMFCLWRIWENASNEPDLSFLDFKTLDFLTKIGADKLQFDSQLDVLLSTYVARYGGSVATGVNNLIMPSHVPDTMKQEPKPISKSLTRLRQIENPEKYVNRVDENRGDIPLPDPTEEQAEDVMKYINDIHARMGEGPDEAEGAEAVPFPEFLMTQQEGGGSSSSKASKWASIALGAVVTLVASLVKR